MYSQFRKIMYLLCFNVIQTFFSRNGLSDQYTEKLRISACFEKILQKVVLMVLIASLQVVEIGIRTSAFPETTLCPKNSTSPNVLIRSMKCFQYRAIMYLQSNFKNINDHMLESVLTELTMEYIFNSSSILMYKTKFCSSLQ